MLRLYISAPRVAKNRFVSGLLKQILPATGGEWPRKGSPAGKTPWVTEVGWEGLKLECGHTHSLFFPKKYATATMGRKGRSHIGRRAKSSHAKRHNTCNLKPATEIVWGFCCFNDYFMRTVLPEEISRHMGKRGEEQQAPNINLKGERGALRV